MKTQKSRAQKGFTLLELMVVMIIIGILAAIAVPTYQGQVKRAKFTEVVGATAPYKAAVEGCIQKKGSVHADCDNDANGIPAAPSAFGNVASITVANGVITATGHADNVDGKTYTLTPTYSSGNVTWAVGGTCAAAGYCD